MQVTGFQIRELIRRFEMVSEASSKQWGESLFVFEGDEKTGPEEIMKSYKDAERKVAAIQTAQMRYNLQVKVKVLDEEMTLAEAVKMVGGAGRAEKMWKSHAINTGRESYSRIESSRPKDSEFAKRSVSVKECLKNANESAKFAGALRAAIAEGNSTKVDVASINLDPKLFE